MTSIAAYLRTRASTRAVGIALIVVIAFILAFRFYLVPAYQAVSGGFVPFDMQFPLGRTAMVIQMGAFGPRTLLAYLRFGIADMLFSPALAAATMLLWAWLINQAAVRQLSQWFAEGLWVAALFPMICDLGENTLFMRIVFSDRFLPDAMDTAILIHRAKSVMTSLTSAITVALAVGALLGWIRRRTGAGQDAGQGAGQRMGQRMGDDGAKLP
ncbi:MAG: hypothetical protein KDE14_00240 [Rhodobacteraceae bacterium]|nr:hypothetical protein [Paracoccaceae bacterium]